MSKIYSSKHYNVYNAQAWPNDNRIDALISAPSSDAAFTAFKDKYGVAPEYLSPVRDYAESEFLIVDGDVE